MILRKEQLEAFADGAAKRFEDRLIAHVSKFFPKDCAALGGRLREEVRYGIDRAGAYGLVSERETCKFVDVMFAFGRDFDAGGQFPWGAEVLNDPTIRDPAVRADHLVDEAHVHYGEAPSVTQKWRS